MPYSIGSNTIITEGDSTPAAANASFRNFFYRYSLNPATYTGTVGTNYGYITGGQTGLPAGTAVPPGSIPNLNLIFPLYHSSPPTFINIVERFPFASYINSVQVSSALSTTRSAFASQSSKTAGYSSGGYLPVPAPLTATTPANDFFVSLTSSTVVDSFPFVSMGIITVTSAGSLSAARFGCSGHQSDTSGFTSGGSTSNTNPVGVRTIDSFPFASFVTATSSGLLFSNTVAHAGHSSPVSGFTSGGFSPIMFAQNSGGSLGTALTGVTRFPFSVSPVTASSVATLTTARGYVAGGSSITNGYTFGGFASNPGRRLDGLGFGLTSVERFNFSEQTVTVAANPVALNSKGCHSVINSEFYAYLCGGYSSASQQATPGPGNPVFLYPAPAYNTADIYPFASTVTIGTLTMTAAKGNCGGNQY